MNSGFFTCLLKICIGFISQRVIQVSHDTVDRKMPHCERGMGKRQSDFCALPVSSPHIVAFPWSLSSLQIATWRLNWFVCETDCLLNSPFAECTGASNDWLPTINLIDCSWSLPNISLAVPIGGCDSTDEGKWLNEPTYSLADFLMSSFVLSIMDWLLACSQERLSTIFGLISPRLLWSSGRTSRLESMRNKRELIMAASFSLCSNSQKLMIVMIMIKEDDRGGRIKTFGSY